MTKISNSKFKNTGIIYELLVRQVAADTMSGKDSAALPILKKYFNKTELFKEYKIYQVLISSKSLNETKAEIFINTALDASLKLNRTNLRREKYNLIKEIKEKYDLENFFKAKINNYKQYAAIYNLIESKHSSEFIDPSSVIDNRITLLEHITKKSVDKDSVKDKVLEEYENMDKGTRILAYRLFLEKFNQKYDFLENNQKNILSEYINNISNTVKLREFVNTQLIKSQKILTELSAKVTDPTTKIKLQEVISLIKPFDKNQNVKDDDLVILLQYNQLINELKAIK